MKSEKEIFSDFNSAMDEGRATDAREIADRNFELFIRYALSDLTLEYLRAAVAGDRRNSDGLLSRIVAIGDFLAETKGDRYVADSALYLKNLPPQKLEEQLSLVRQYIEAINTANSINVSEKRRGFEQIKRLSARFSLTGDSQRAERADLRYAAYLYESNRLEESLVYLEKYLPVIESHVWPYKKAWVLNQLGITRARLGSDEIALKYCRQAVEILGSLREWQFQAKALQFLSVAYRRYGDLDSALANDFKSLRIMLQSLPRPSDLAYTYLDIAHIYWLRGNPRLGLLYAQEALPLALSAKDANRSAQIVSFIAHQQAMLGEFDRAFSGLKRSIEMIEEIDAGSRAYTEPLILIRSGQIAFAAGQAQQAIEHYNRAEVLASKIEDRRFHLINALRGRASAHAKMGQVEEARKDIARAIKEIEDYRLRISQSEHRSSFLEAAQGAFDEAISLNATAFGRPDEAFNMSERGRARSLLDEISSRPRSPHSAGLSKNTGPLTLKEVQSALPDDLTLLEYSVTEGRVFIFVVTHSNFEVVVSPIASDLLDRLVSDYVSEMKKTASLQSLNDTARELFHHLVEPVEGRIRKDSRICIVPDKSLHFIPFAALVTPSDRYLVESFSLSYAPSASVLAFCNEEQKKKSAAPTERLLAIANPDLSEGEFSHLDPLPDAEREASQSASFYSDSTILKRADATEARVTRALSDCDVAHLGVHCLVREKSPWLAALILSGGRKSEGGTGSDDGALTLDEIYKIDLPRTRLVVLSACETALGQYYRGEGIVSIVRPLISARVPEVVASLWSVDSSATADLMIEFHRQRKLSFGRTGEALRRAQMKMISSGHHPFYWSPFIAIGSAR